MKSKSVWNSATRRWTKSLQFLVIPPVLHFGRKRARQPHLKTPLSPPQLSDGGGTNSLWWKLVNCDRNSIRGSRNEDVHCLFIHAGENQNVRIAWILLQPSLLRVYVTGVAASRRKEVKHPQFAHLCISRHLWDSPGTTLGTGAPLSQRNFLKCRPIWNEKKKKEKMRKATEIKKKGRTEMLLTWGRERGGEKEKTR